MKFDSHLQECYNHLMNFSLMPKFLKDFSIPFTNNGFEIYIVGGAVRDYCLGKPNSDYDFTTDALPEDVKKLFKKVIPTGIKHGTVTVLFQNNSFEVTTFRTESNYSDSRHPDSIEFVKNLEEDLKRRDFTINALAVKLPNKKIIDLHGGIKDLKDKVIRCIGEPKQRFEEDALRMMRACRFSAKLNFEIEEKTFDAIKSLKENIKLVSIERINEEFTRILNSPYPRRGIEALRESGLLQIILPELTNCINVEQLGFHHEDVYNHCLSTLEAAVYKNYSFEVRLAALLHDIGKPATRKLEQQQQQLQNQQQQQLQNQHYTFYNHEKVGAKIAQKLLRRLKFSNAQIEKTLILIENHMFNYTSSWKDGAIRRFVIKVGKDNLQELFQLRLCDQAAISNSFLNEGLIELEERINNLDSPSLTINDLDLTGEDLMALNLKPGPIFSEIKKFLLDQVLNDPRINNKETLKQMTLTFLSNKQ